MHLKTGAEMLKNHVEEAGSLEMQPNETLLLQA